jgi:hypothetical protein
MRYPLGWLVCEINIDIDIDTMDDAICRTFQYQFRGPVHISMIAII